MNVSAGLSVIIALIAIVVGIILIISGGVISWLGAALVAVALVAGGAVVTG